MVTYIFYCITIVYILSSLVKKKIKKYRKPENKIYVKKSTKPLLRAANYYSRKNLKRQMFTVDFISGSQNFTQHLTSGVLILIHSADSCILVMECVDCARTEILLSDLSWIFACSYHSRWRFQCKILEKII